jgi:DNA gyrase/topoisomerase IV subunit A
VLEETFPLPLILVNGAEGHGAFLPPHSPSELARAALLTLEHSNVSLEILRRNLQGPDFPDGGVLLELGIQELWQGGEPTLRSRAEVRLEHGPQGRVRVVLSALPWPMTGKELKAAVLELEAEGALQGVRSVEDQSSATGQRVEIELDHLAYAWLATEAIYKSRIHELSWRGELRVRSGQYARRVGLADLMSAFIEHRKEVAVKRLDKAVAQARIRAQGAEAVWLALSLLEPVLAVMREALDDAEAVKGLMNFMRPEYRSAVEMLPFRPSHGYDLGFTEQQAKHLLTVRKLPSRQRETALRDWVAVQAEVDAARARLSDRQAVLQLVREELQEAIARYDGPRRTRIL